MRKITFYTILFALSCIGAVAQTARVQVIHNSTDAAAAVVDVYVNGTMFLDNLEFRTASPFLDAPAGTPLTIVVAPGSSTSAADGVYTTTTTLTENGTYIIVASGMVSTTGYTPNQPFNLYMYNTARETATMAANTDVLMFHGSTDSPTIDVVHQGNGVIVNDISYGEFKDYLELDNDDYMINITTADNGTVIQGYSLPLDLLNLDGEAVTVLTSGFLHPENNSNGPGFSVWVALPGGGDLLQLPQGNDVARVQVIHNAADAAASTVDIYVNDDIYLDDFQFRTATPFVDVAAGIPLTIVVAPGNSISAADGVFTKNITFQEDETYIIVASGIVSETGYTPNQPFNLYVYPVARETAAIGATTDILVFHGATDAPTINIAQQGSGVLIGNTSYGQFNGYQSVSATQDQVISVTTANGASIIETYELPLQTQGFAGKAITLLASGFLTPENNSNGSDFGLWAALPTGGNLYELPLGQLGVSRPEMQHVSIYPNPSASVVNIALPDGFSSIETTLYDISGRKVLTAKGSTTIDVSGLNTGMYVMEMIIDGLPTTQKIMKQ